jgi:hypothetical protein
MQHAWLLRMEEDCRPLNMQLLVVVVRVVLYDPHHAHYIQSSCLVAVWRLLLTPAAALAVHHYQERANSKFVIRAVVER